MSDLISLQSKLLDLIKEMGLSDRELLRRAGLSHTYLNGVRRGSSMTIEKMEMIINAFPELGKELFRNASAEYNATSASSSFSKKEFYEVVSKIRSEQSKSERNELLDRLVGMVGVIEDELGKTREDLITLVKSFRKIQP